MSLLLQRSQTAGGGGKTRGGIVFFRLKFFCQTTKELKNI